MNCQTIQRRLLGAEATERPAPDVQAHLDACPPCREWQARLVQVEQIVRDLPVPESRARAAFVRKLQGREPAAASSSVTPVPQPARVQGAKSRPVIRRVPSPAATAAGVPFPWRLWTAGMAAALVLSAVTWSVVREPMPVSTPAPKARPDPLVASLVEHDVRLAKAKEKTERAAALKAMADDLSRERQSLEGAAEADGLLRDFSDWFSSVDAAFEKLSSGSKVNTVTSVSEAPKASAARVRQLQRNRGVIAELVAAGLRLASEDERFKRVEHCWNLANSIAKEIRSAAAGQEGPRAVELGNIFKHLLDSGVAANLHVFRKEVPSGSAFEKEFQRVGVEVRAKTAELEDSLRLERDRAAGLHRGEMDQVLAAVKEGRELVLGAVKL